MRFIAIFCCAVAVLFAEDSSWVHGERLFLGQEPLKGRITGHTTDLPAEASVCANCHNSGQPLGPALNRSALVEPNRRRGGPPSSYDAKRFCRTLETGVDPAFVVIPRVMPRYTLGNAQCQSLWLYLTEKNPALAASHEFGPVRPAESVPDIIVRRQDGISAPLTRLLAGQVTAVQLMFTRCRATCPMQGALFARVQKSLPGHAARGIQLLTLSIDPEHDGPASLQAWLKRFHAAAGWLAATPSAQGLEKLRGFFGKGENAADPHSTQVFLIDRQGQLVFRTIGLPDAEEVAALLQQMAAAGPR